MDKYLNEDAITAEIMSYVKNRIYNYAVLIDGDMQFSSMVIGEQVKHTSSRKVLSQPSKVLAICLYTFLYTASTLRTLFRKRLRFPF